MADTIYVCSKCGDTINASELRGNALADYGWLIGPHKAGRGRMVVRCPKHVTNYAMRSVPTDRNIPAIH